MDGGARRAQHCRMKQKLILRKLELVAATIATVADALRHQNADCDADYALVLMRLAGDPLDMCIEALREKLRLTGLSGPDT